MRQVIFSSVSLSEANKEVAVESDAAVTITFYGSCYGVKPKIMTGLILLINGRPTGVAEIFSDEPNIHRNVVPISFTHSFEGLPTDLQEFAITTNGDETKIDSNDRFTVVIDY